MDAAVLIVAQPADASVAQAARVVDHAAEVAITRPREQFAPSPVAGMVIAVAGPVVPVLTIDGIATPLAPDDPQALDEVVDFLYRAYGDDRRYYLGSLIEQRRAALNAGPAFETPTSEPGFPDPRPPYTPAERDAEFAALDRLAQAVSAAWDRLYLRVGVLLEFVDTAARLAMHDEIEKARSLAAYNRYGLARNEEDDEVTVANTDVFRQLADGLRRLAQRREELRETETAETVAGYIGFAALLRYLYSGSGGVFEDPGVRLSRQLQQSVARARIDAAEAYADTLRTLAETFPLAWHLDDDLSSEADDATIGDWSVAQLRRTHEALSEIYRGAVLRDPPRFTTNDPVATVLHDAESEWSVWQYAQVVSLGLVRSNQPPGTLAWCASMEALHRIAEQRLPREEDNGWLFGALLLLASFIPGIGKFVAVYNVLAITYSTYQNIVEAIHQRTAHLAALDPVSVLAVPDVPLGAVVTMSLLNVSFALLPVGHGLVRFTNFRYYANRLLYVARKFCLGLWFIRQLTGGRSIQVAYRNRAVIALVQASQRKALRGMEDIFMEIRTAEAASEAAAGAVGATVTAGESTAARATVELARQDVNRLIAALAEASVTRSLTAGTQSETFPPTQGGGGSSTQPPTSGTTSPTTASYSRSIPDIEQLLETPALLEHAVDDFTTLLRKKATSFPSNLFEDRDFIRTVLLQTLAAFRQYTSTYTLRRQLAEGLSLQEARTLDVDGIVNHIAGKVNELLAMRYGGLAERLTAEATARYAVAQSGTWEYPRRATQLEIDTGTGYKLAQDLGAYSRGTGPNQGKLRLWAWAQITFGDQQHLLVQTGSDLYRLRVPGAKIRIDGIEYDVELQVVGSPPLPGSAAAANTAIIGAATRAPSPDVASGLAYYGVISFKLPWSSEELRTIVREVLRRANKLGQ